MSNAEAVPESINERAAVMVQEMIGGLNFSARFVIERSLGAFGKDIPSILRKMDEEMLTNSVRDYIQRLEWVLNGSSGDVTN